MFEVKFKKNYLIGVTRDTETDRWVGFKKLYVDFTKNIQAK